MYWLVTHTFCFVHYYLQITTVCWTTPEYDGIVCSFYMDLGGLAYQQSIKQNAFRIVLYIIFQVTLHVPL